MKTAEYKFKQAELYTICRFILEAVGTPEILTRFSNFKAKYNTAWLAARNIEVDAAEDAPDEQNRNSVHETKRIQLLGLNQRALDKFNSLERYIAEVIPAAEQKPAIEAAGGLQYPEAADADFDSTTQLLNNMVNYINNNETTLLNSGLNMPATFKTEVQDLQTAFNLLHADFLGSEGGAELLTQEKITLNNALYNNIVRSINADAQAIFTGEDEAAMRKQFTLEQQLYLVRGAGVAGMRFLVTDSTTNLPVAEATVTIPSRNYAALTDDQGRLVKLQLAAGSYAIEVTKPGYARYTDTVAIETGTVKRINISLTPQ